MRYFVGYRPENGENQPVTIEQGAGFFQNRIYHFHGNRLAASVRFSTQIDFFEFCFEYANGLIQDYPSVNLVNPLL